MASTHLPFAAIQALPDSYWEDEASVNGIWNGLIATAFPGTTATGEKYVIQPEGQALTTRSKRRNDLLVRQIVDPSRGEVIIRLAFEGKGSNGSSLDEASGQLLQYVRNAGSTARGGDKVWCIVAKGTTWKASLYDGGKTWDLSFRGSQPSFSITSSGGQVMDVKADPDAALRWLRWFQCHRTVLS